MDKIVNGIQILCHTMKNFITELTIEQITLISIFVTLSIFLLGRKSEIKFKKLEVRRVEYKKFINLLQKVYSKKMKLDDKTRTEFFDTGVSLLIYGSKRVYKKYTFFREYSYNPIVEKSKHNTNTIGIYIIADILKTIRHEVGMSNFGELESNEVLSFFVNDVGMNPLSKKQAAKSKYDIRMLKLEMFMVDRYSLVFLNQVYYNVVKPIFGFLFILFKYLIVIPFAKLIKIIFPKWAQKVENKLSCTK